MPRSQHVDLELASAKLDDAMLAITPSLHHSIAPSLVTRHGILPRNYPPRLHHFDNWAYGISGIALPALS